MLRYVLYWWTGKQAGTTRFFPQRGTGLWNEWGWTNTVQTYLTAGEHGLTLEFLPQNYNMNMLGNQAMADALRLRRIMKVAAGK